MTASTSPSTSPSPNSHQKQQSSAPVTPIRNVNLSNKSPSPRRDDSTVHDTYSNFSFQNYIKKQVLGITNVGIRKHLNPNPASVGNIQNFLNVPFQIEYFVSLGLALCLDSYLYVVTFLPIRCVCAVLCFAFELFRDVVSRLFCTSKVKAGNKNKQQSVSYNGLATNAIKTSYLSSTRLYDLLSGCLVCIGFYALHMLNMSRVYHFIRSQSMIKLYVLTSIFEVCDKLLTSFGQDSLDALIWQCQESNGPVAFSFIVASIYVIVHSCLLFLYVATVTVACNSSDHALIIVIILNNFGEIKSFVFKQFDTQSLFQLSCSEITERFNLMISLTCIIIVGISQDASSFYDAIPTYSSLVLVMICGESLADWFKHAFITRFNHINASVYKDFSRILMIDYLHNNINSQESKSDDGTALGSNTSTRYNNNKNDLHYTVSKRIGFAQIPIVCNSLRYFKIAFTSSHLPSYLSTLTLMEYGSVIGGFFTLVLTIKLVLGFALIFYSMRVCGKEWSESRSSNERADYMHTLSSLQRYSAWKGKVLG